MIGDSIHREISSICKRDVVLFPFLSDVFSTELFKNFAFVVFAIFNSFKKELRGADQFGTLRQEKNFLFIRGIEAESIAGTAGSRIKSEDVGKNFACSDDRVEVAFEVKTEDVIVSVGEFVVAIDEVVKEGDVRHFWNSFLYSLLLSGTIIHPPDAFVNPLFKKILGFCADLQFVHNSIS